MWESNLEDKTAIILNFILLVWEFSMAENSSETLIDSDVSVARGECGIWCRIVWERAFEEKKSCFRFVNRT